MAEQDITKPFKYQELFKKFDEVLGKKPEALRFVIAYGRYIEVVDDLVDEPKNLTFIRNATEQAALLFTSNYWLANGRELILVERVIHMVYFASVKWETATELWKQRDAKVLSHAGYFMLFAILLLESGDQERCQEMLLEFMEKVHAEHYGDLPPEVANA